MDTAEKTYFVFFSRIPNSNVIFPDGSQANFTNGRYATDDPSKANFLKSECKLGNPYIYFDPDKEVVTETDLDPMAEYNARIIAAYEAKKAAEDKTVDRGTSDQGKLNVADTRNIASAESDSDSPAVKPALKITLPSTHSR